jgi:uncharacterized protein YbbC (DUF1343 family)
MIYPKVGQIWINSETYRKETIVSVGDRIVTYNYDCDYELFLETYTIDVDESVKNLQKQVDVLLYDIQELKVKAYIPL